MNINNYLDGGRNLISLIQKEWKNIRTSYHRGKIKNSYNFRLQDDKETIVELLWKVFYDQTSPFRINLGFSFILKNKLTNELRFWDNQENIGLLNRPTLIASHSDFVDFLKNFSKIDYEEKLFEMRPNTKWMLHRILSLGVYTYKINEGYSVLKD